MIDVIAFDADDTLWHNETLYRAAEDKLKHLLSGYASASEIEAALYETEMRNLALTGYGIKAFVLSMIETAIALSGGEIRGEEIGTIIGFGRDMMTAPVRVFDHVEETLVSLSAGFTLMVITKGDLLDQERKLAGSGLSATFSHFEVVSDKTSDVYGELLARHQIDPQRFLMVGNSLRSDILPVVALGGQAVYIPHHLTWAHENDIQPGCEGGRYHELEHIGLLPDLIARLNSPGT